VRVASRENDSTGSLAGQMGMDTRNARALAGHVALLAAVGVAAGHDDVRISLDVKDAAVVDVVNVLAEAAGLQVVFDPDVSCRLTLKLTRVPWATAMDLTLRACQLGREGEDAVVRIAPVSRLAEEEAARRRREEERARAPLHSLTLFRLSHARAEQIAPLLKRLLPGGDVTYDARTNTLIVLR
jgi:type II secretory pathway component HofQ